MIHKQLGDIILDIAPDVQKNNPRNSEGAFISLKNGNILFAYSKFKGKSSEDSATADICMFELDEEGNQLGSERVILRCEEEEAVNIMSISLLRMSNGDIGLFYLVRSSYTRLQMFLRRSDDDGITWGERILCTNQDAFFVVNNDRVVQLSNGRILIPAAVHRTGYESTISDSIYFDSNSDVVFFYSDDDGRNWNCSNSRICNPFGKPICTSGLQEPGIIELGKGLIWGWARTDLGRQFEMFSFDYGDSWSPCKPSRFTAPNSPLSMKRSSNGSIYTIWNPIPEYNGRNTNQKIFTGGRTPLVIAASKDNGVTFSEPVAFEEDQESGFCYCAMHFTERNLFLAYCAGSVADGSCLNRIRIRKIPLVQLINDVK